MNYDKMPFHIGCREGWGCSLKCPVRQLLDHARDLDMQLKALQNKPVRKQMDKGTAADMVEDLQIEIVQLREQLRQVETERDQWQRQAVNND